MSIHAVTVVGGGFGSYVAERLASMGWSVEIYERAPNRRVVCGGLVSDETLRKFPVLEDFAVHRIDGAVISSGSEEVFIERKGVAWVLDRNRMFRDMLERAQAEGVVLKGVWKKERGKVLVGADGAVSEVRKLVTDEEPTFILGYQGEARWREDDHYVRVDFGPWSDVFFGWVIPLGNGKARVGIGVSLEKSGEARSLLGKYAEFLGVKVSSPSGRLIPISKPLKKIAKGSVVLVGDAAVHTKASTGGGIAYGFRGMEGIIPIVNKFLGEEGSLEEANASHRRHIYPKLKLHWFIHKFYNRASMEELLRSVKELGLDEEMKKKGSMDDPSFLFSTRFLSLIPRTFSPFLRTLPELF